MKKFFSVILMLVLLLSLTSCKGQSNYKKCEKHLKSHLKDPNSYVMYSAVGYELDSTYAFKISYDAKNSYGGYNGAETEYVYIDESGEICCRNCDYGSGLAFTAYYVNSVSGKKIYDKTK